jgi:hypothetical protein
MTIAQSYLNGTIGQLTNATWGFDVAWRRVVCVLIGITAAWIFSYGMTMKVVGSPCANHSHSPSGFLQ